MYFWPHQPLLTKFITCFKCLNHCLHFITSTSPHLTYFIPFYNGCHNYNPINIPYFQLMWWRMIYLLNFNGLCTIELSIVAHCSDNARSRHHWHKIIIQTKDPGHHLRVNTHSIETWESLIQVFYIFLNSNWANHYSRWSSSSKMIRCYPGGGTSLACQLDIGLGPMATQHECCKLSLGFQNQIEI